MRERDRERFGLVKMCLIIRPFRRDHEFIFVTLAPTPENPIKKRGVESIGVSWKLPEA